MLLPTRPVPMILTFDEELRPLLFLGDHTRGSAWEEAVSAAANQVELNYEAGAVPISTVATDAGMATDPPRWPERLIPRPVKALLFAGAIALSVMINTGGPEAAETQTPADRGFGVCEGSRDLATYGASYAVACRGGIASGDWEAGTVHLLEVSGALRSIAFINEDRFVVTDASKPVIHEISTEPLQHVRTVGIQGVATDTVSANGRVYLAVPSIGALLVLNETTLDQIDRIDVGEAPMYVTYAAESGLLVSDVLTHSLYTVDEYSGEVISTIDGIWGIGEPFAGPDGAWVASRYDGYVLHVTHGQIESNKTAQHRPSGIVVWNGEAVVEHEQGDIRPLDYNEAPAWKIVTAGHAIGTTVSNDSLLVLDGGSGALLIFDQPPDQ